jgi:hypothetical protein
VKLRFIVCLTGTYSGVRPTCSFINFALAITVSILQKKTYLRSVDPKQPKNVKFSLWSIVETFPRGGAWLFRGGAKILRGGAKILRGGAKRSQESGEVCTSPYLPSKSGHVSHNSVERIKGCPRGPWKSWKVLELEKNSRTRKSVDVLEILELISLTSRGRLFKAGLA